MTTTPTSTGELVERAKYALTKGSMFVSGHYQLIADLLSALQKAEGDKVETESHRALYAKTLFRLRDTLLNVTDCMVEEGDRTYFGSTNDADALHAIALKIDDLHWSEVLAHTQPKVNLYEAIENRIIEREAAENRAQAAEARVKALEEDNARLKIERNDAIAALSRMCGDA